VQISSTLQWKHEILNGKYVIIVLEAMFGYHIYWQKTPYCSWNRNVSWPTDTQFYGRQKKLDWSSADQHLSIICFCENIRTSNFVFDNVFTEGVFVTHLFSDVGISVWQFVWVTTNALSWVIFLHEVTSL